MSQTDIAVRRLSGTAWGTLLAAALVLSITAAVTIGPASISAFDVWGSALKHLGLGGIRLPGLLDGIVWDLRLPRVLTAACVGAGLAMSGVVMQAITRNALADPYLLGLSSGASLGAVAVLLLGVAILLPVAAFAGAMAALVVTLALATASGSLTPTKTVLAGLAISSLASSVTSFVIFWSAQGDSYREVLGWLMGSLGGATWQSVVISAGALLVVGSPIVAAGRILDGFAFGDASAASLGINVPAVRWVMLAAAALLTGAMVAVSGSIGFVGLILPHMVRLLVGTGHRALLPLSALAGALFLVWADTLARSVLGPVEVPVGIITALVGAPVFALLLWRKGAAA
ncbi:iron chelate uptake ABC transporter family permease subunit [Arthrobacter sp. I2-34]|uniref:Iron chelate uptake ABC transporter family permease subunit n=1 Tax=Arthrobacter hankyongi TaxID=2904801 RepID=A0ABS9L315_9MICC|nr:putative F420-0 ABC transporter permease subunit [Arthrobacter hankyongi]MCG2621075.1 iron chelate uptake ABC transporter family permease subunit [Arthrobacter hankyongi]